MRPLFILSFLLCHGHFLCAQDSSVGLTNAIYAEDLAVSREKALSRINVILFVGSAHPVTDEDGKTGFRAGASFQFHPQVNSLFTLNAGTFYRSWSGFVGRKYYDFAVPLHVGFRLAQNPNALRVHAGIQVPVVSGRVGEEQSRKFFASVHPYYGISKRFEVGGQRSLFADINYSGGILSLNLGYGLFK